MNEEMGCLAIILIFVIAVCAFRLGVLYGEPGEHIATKPHCEMALHQERCVDTLFYVTKPYTRRETR